MSKLFVTVVTIITMCFMFETTIGYSNLRSSSLDDKIMEKTCLGKYTGVFHKFLYFADNETSTDYYAIRTPWLITYPKKIKTELLKNNLTLIDESVIKKCGWTTLAHVKNTGVSTGTIYSFSATIESVEDRALLILTNNYPIVEMLLVLIGSLLFFVLFLACSCYWNVSVYSSDYIRHRG